MVGQHQSDTAAARSAPGGNGALAHRHHRLVGRAASTSVQQVVGQHQVDAAGARAHRHHHLVGGAAGASVQQLVGQHQVDV